MNKKTWLILSLAALACIVLVLGISKLVDSTTGMKPGETYAPEETVVVDGAVLHYRAQLAKEAFPEGTNVGDWLSGCSDSDRNGYFDGFVLRHEAVNGDMTTYTYLVYIPGATTDTSAPALFEGDTYGYRIDLYRTAPSEEGYTLSRVAVTLPTAEEAPRLRVLVDGDAMGMLVSVSDEEIPTGELDWYGFA